MKETKRLVFSIDRSILLTSRFIIVVFKKDTEFYIEYLLLIKCLEIIAIFKIHPVLE